MAWELSSPDVEPRATPMPEGFQPKARHRTLAAELGVNLEEAFALFTEHHASKGNKFKDWNLALNTWLRREKQFSRNLPSRPSDLQFVFKGPARSPCPIGFCDGSGWYIERRTYERMACECRNRTTPDTMPPEANAGTPSPAEVEQMARRRFQAPTPFREGHFWWLFHWQDEFAEGKRVRKRKRTKLAPVSMSEREVKKIAAEILRPVNQGLVTVGSAVNFKEYVESTYIPTELPLLAKTTQDSYQGTIRKYLEPTFNGLCLRDLTPLTLQRYFSGLAGEGIAYPSILKIRDTLSSILRSAVRYGFLVTNPMDGLQMPPDKRPRRPKPVITPEQFANLVEFVSEPYASMLFVSVWTGLRISELIGLKWRCVHADSITVEERYCRGDWSNPKTNASAATIGVAPEVIARLLRLKSLTVEVRAGLAVRKYKLVKSDEPDALVFQSVQGGKPMQGQNILQRHVQPVARRLGLKFVTWRCLRTSHATWLVQAGADPKSVQGQMRHSRIATTMDIYAQCVPAAQRQAIAKLSEFAQPRSITVPINGAFKC